MVSANNFLIFICFFWASLHGEIVSSLLQLHVYGLLSIILWTLFIYLHQCVIQTSTVVHMAESVNRISRIGDIKIKFGKLKGFGVI